jgi:hypothetical protein
MNPHYYIMKEKKILRLEEEVRFDELSSIVKEQLLISDEFIPLNQEQANWRVVIYRDEILELDEYKNWLIEKDSEAQELT